MLPRPFFIPLLVGVAAPFAGGGGLVLGMVVSDHLNLAPDSASMDTVYAIGMLTGLAFALVGVFVVVAPYHYLSKRHQRRRQRHFCRE